MMRLIPVALLLLLFTSLANAQPEADTIALVTEAIQGDSYSLSIQILIMMTLLTLLPAAVLSTSDRPPDARRDSPDRPCRPAS